MKNVTYLNKELALPIGIQDGTQGGFARSARRPRTRNGSNPCTSIMPDGSTKVFSASAPAQASAPSAPRTIVKVVKAPTYRNNYEARLAMLGRATEGLY